MNFIFHFLFFLQFFLDKMKKNIEKKSRKYFSSKWKVESKKGARRKNLYLFRTLDSFPAGAAIADVAVALSGVGKQQHQQRQWQHEEHNFPLFFSFSHFSSTISFAPFASHRHTILFVAISVVAVAVTRIWFVHFILLFSQYNTMLCSTTFHPRITIQLHFTIQCSGIRYDAMRYDYDNGNDSPCCAYTNGAYSIEHKHKQHHSISIQ